MGRLGIIAGGGALPAKLVAACQRDSNDCFVLGLQGQTDRQTQPNAWVRLGATDEAISILKAHDVDRLVLAGYIRRPSIQELKPDLRTLKLFAKLGAKAFGDDALLRVISDELQREGFSIVGAHEIEPALISLLGVFGKISPTAEHNTDIEIGFKVAKELGRMDVGQAVVVQQGIVLGVEAIEGTDVLLQRCKKLRRKGRGGVLVKVCKPQQDKKLDMPTIGQRTVTRAYEAGLEGIAVEAGATIILDREETANAADKLNMFLTGVQQ